MFRSKKFNSGIIMVICALMLVFGAVVVVNDDAVASSADIKVTYTLGEGPAASAVPSLPAEESWSIGSTHKVAAAPECSDTNFVFLYWEEVTTGDKYGEKLDYLPEDVKNEIKQEYDTTNPSAAIPEVEFEAVWGVVVTYDLNLNDPTENITVPEKEVILYKDDYTITADDLKAVNYTFLGWASESKKDADIAEYKKGDTFEDLDKSLTLYAVWKANFYSVIYHANTGSDETDSAVIVPVDSTKYMGSNLKATIMGDGKLATSNANYATMKDAIPTRTDYTFKGWATTADAVTAEYQPGATIATMSKDVDLYAVWEKGSAAAESTDKTKTSTTPQTGDSDQLGLYIIMAILSLLGIGYLCHDQKKAKVTK